MEKKVKKKNKKTLIIIIGAVVAFFIFAILRNADFTDWRLPQKHIEGSAYIEDDTFYNVGYVMIYNPLIYGYDINEEEYTANVLFTGDIVSQMDVAQRSSNNDGVDATIPEVNAYRLSYKTDSADNGTLHLDPVYSVGDKHAFFCDVYTEDGMRTKKEFACIYEGQYCYIWCDDGTVDEKIAKIYADEFDNKIYPQDVAYFGPVRFTENGGKVHILFYKFNESDMNGVFQPADIFSSVEVSEEMAEEHHYNLDHAIISVNSESVKNTEDRFGTIAHELQHMICQFSIVRSNNRIQMATWLNEAMSAKAEELIYPGSKDRKTIGDNFYYSDTYRKGQSLYNFTDANDRYVGNYGAVYLYSKYIEAISGKDTFSKLQLYWAESGNYYITEAEAMYNAFPQEEIDRIDATYEYSDAIKDKIGNAYNFWMSKLTLDFYLETLSMDLSNLHTKEEKMKGLMLYRDGAPAYLEGGGRIVISVKDNQFTIPDDSDEGLVYIGLDEKMQPCTAIVCH